MQTSALNSNAITNNYQSIELAESSYLLASALDARFILNDLARFTDDNDVLGIFPLVKGWKIQGNTEAASWLADRQL